MNEPTAFAHPRGAWIGVARSMGWEEHEIEAVTRDLRGTVIRYVDPLQVILVPPGGKPLRHLREPHTVGRISQANRLYPIANGGGTNWQDTGLMSQDPAKRERINHRVECEEVPFADLLPGGTWEAWTDGSGNDQEGPAGVGVVLLHNGTVVCEASEYVGNGTNQVAEVRALGRALALAGGAPKNPDRTKHLCIYSDSQNALDWVRPGGQYVGFDNMALYQLVAKVRAEAALWPNLVLTHVPGHSGIGGNERADRLAGRAFRLGKTELASEMSIAVIDTETTGLDAKLAQVIEIAAVIADVHGTVKTRWSRKIRLMPGKEKTISPQAMEVHGYDPRKPEWNDHAVPMEQALKEFRAILPQTYVFVAHNADFDRKMLVAAHRAIGDQRWKPSNYKFCTQKELARPLRKAGILSSEKLSALCEHFGIDMGRAHNATDDVESTLGCYIAAKKKPFGKVEPQ